MGWCDNPECGVHQIFSMDLPTVQTLCSPMVLEGRTPMILPVSFSKTRGQHTVVYRGEGGCRRKYRINVGTVDFGPWLSWLVKISFGHQGAPSSVGIASVGQVPCDWGQCFSTRDSRKLSSPCGCQVGKPRGVQDFGIEEFLLPKVGNGIIGCRFILLLLFLFQPTWVLHKKIKVCSESSKWFTAHTWESSVYVGSEWTPLYLFWSGSKQLGLQNQGILTK